jgi:signal transduction histidine kinase
MNTDAQRSPVDLSALLQRETSDRPRDKTSLTIPVHDSGAFVVEGDAVALRRVFANLIDNAMAYGTHCEITLELTEGKIAVEIGDDGPGIPEAERERAFEPFYRADTSRSRATGGSGLGLAIARQIVEAHGGKISIRRSKLGGAGVRVELPVPPSGGDIA